MKSLYILYDAECSVCRNCSRWLQKQPAFVELKPIPLQSPQTPNRFPGIDKLNLRKDLVVITDEGDLYQGAPAWIMCLYALKAYREWAFRLSEPELLPFARRICTLISDHRLKLSNWFPDRRSDRARAEALPGLRCESRSGYCE